MKAKVTRYSFRRPAFCPLLLLSSWSNLSGKSRCMKLLKPGCKIYVFRRFAKLSPCSRFKCLASFASSRALLIETGSVSCTKIPVLSEVCSGKDSWYRTDVALIASRHWFCLFRNTLETLLLLCTTLLFT